MAMGWCEGGVAGSRVVVCGGASLRCYSWSPLLNPPTWTLGIDLALQHAFVYVNGELQYGRIKQCFMIT